MARSKKPVVHPAGPARTPVRRRPTDQPSETVTGDLNEPPTLSADVHVDTSSSQPPSPDKTTISSTQTLEDETLQAEEEERKLEEEYQMRLSAIKKKREEADRKKKEEEERRLKEEENRRQQEEEERRKKEEDERRKQEEEEQKRKDEEDRLRQEQERKKKEMEKKKEADRIKKEKVKDTMDAMQTEPSEDTGLKRKLRSQPTPTKSGSKSTPKKRPYRGKRPIPSFSTPSDEEESGRNPSDVPLEHPHKATVGTAHAPQGVPRQFTTPGAAAHYECLVSQKLILERGFDEDFVSTSSFLKSRVEEVDWKVIAMPNRRANASLVREFYAEASQVKDPVVTVRGQVVRYSPSEINQVLGRTGATVCEFAQFLKKMTVADENRILKEIAMEGKSWTKDGQRRCLPTAALTTEAAIWFQFVRSSVSPTTHDTTLSMHKCALLYCLLTGRRVNLGTIMHAAIHQARTRKKVILPLPCLVTALLINAGVPTAAEDQWLVSSSPIGEQTLKRMGRRNEKEPETAGPKVVIAEEHRVGTVKPTVGKEAASTSAQPETHPGLEATLQDILASLRKLTYRVEMMEAVQRYKYGDGVKFWSYMRDRDHVINQILIQNDPEIASALPPFPDEICPEPNSEDDPGSEYSAATTPTDSHDM